MKWLICLVLVAGLSSCGGSKEKAPQSEKKDALEKKPKPATAVSTEPQKGSHPKARTAKVVEKSTCAVEKEHYEFETLKDIKRVSKSKVFLYETNRMYEYDRCIGCLSVYDHQGNRKNEDYDVTTWKRLSAERIQKETHSTSMMRIDATLPLVYGKNVICPKMKKGTFAIGVVGNDEEKSVFVKDKKQVEKITMKGSTFLEYASIDGNGNCAVFHDYKNREIYSYNFKSKEVVKKIKYNKGYPVSEGPNGKVFRFGYYVTRERIDGKDWNRLDNIFSQNSKVLIKVDRPVDDHLCFESVLYKNNHLIVERHFPALKQDELRVVNTKTRKEKRIKYSGYAVKRMMDMKAKELILLIMEKNKEKSIGKIVVYNYQQNKFVKEIKVHFFELLQTSFYDYDRGLLILQGLEYGESPRTKSLYDGEHSKTPHYFETYKIEYK